MIAYFDTSALVPLLVDEPSSDVCVRLWDLADRIVATRLVYIEASAAIAAGERLNRLTSRAGRTARDHLISLWSSVDVIEIDALLMIDAARLARTHRLRGYDATHCAAAAIINDNDLVAASGDRRLLDAWSSEGIAVCATHGS